MITRELNNFGDPLYQANGRIAANYQVIFKLSPRGTFDAISHDKIPSTSIIATTNGNGEFSVQLWPTVRGMDKVQYYCSSNIPGFKPFYGKVTFDVVPMKFVEFRDTGAAGVASDALVISRHISNSQIHHKVINPAVIDKFGEVGGHLTYNGFPVAKISTSTPPAVGPTGLTAVQELYSGATASVVKSRVILSWTQALADYPSYDVTVNNEYYITTTNKEVVFEDMTPGEYTFGVRFSDGLNSTSRYATVFLHVTGKTVLTTDVSGVSATWTGRDATVAWLKSADPTVIAYKVVVRSNTAVLREVKEIHTSYTYTYGNMLDDIAGAPVSTLHFDIYNIDSTDLTNTTPATASVTHAVPAAPTAISHEGVVDGIKVKHTAEWTPEIDRVELWASAAINRADSAKAGQFDAAGSEITLIVTGTPATRNLWVKAVNIFGQESVWYPTSPIGGIAAAPTNDPANVLSLLTEQITSSQLHNDLTSRINLIDTPATGLVAKTMALNEALGVINSTLSDIINMPAYDNGVPYATNDIVSYQGGLYRSKGATPAGTLPTNTTYWDKIGDYASLAEAVAGLAASMTNYYTVTAGDQAIATAKTQAITTAGNNASSAISDALSTYSSTATVNTAISQAKTDVLAVVNDASTGLSTKASSTALQTANSTLLSAVATAINQTTTTLNGNSTTVQAMAASVDGIKGQYTIKIETDSVDGRKKIAGIGLNTTGTTSSFEVYADNFSIAHTDPGGATVVPFAIDTVHGVVMNNALIKNLSADVIASGTRLKIDGTHDNIQSVLAIFNDVTGTSAIQAINNSRDATQPAIYARVGQKLSSNLNGTNAIVGVSYNGCGGFFSGNKGAIQLQASTAQDAPTHTASKGTVWIDKDCDWYTNTDNASNWKKVASTPSYISSAISRASNTYWQAEHTITVIVKCLGAYMNNGRIEVSDDNITYTTIMEVGDDININTKWTFMSAVIPKGMYWRAVNNQVDHMWDTFTVTEYQHV